MKNNETGEFELVVGNRQLLSAFFIVVLLFAVSFAMGYVVGQNTQRSVKVAEGASGPAVSNAADRPQPLAPVPSPVTPTASAPTGQTAPADAGPQPSTQPAQQPAQPPAEAQPPAATEAAPSGGPDLATGSYWQVMAVGQATADAVKQTLSTKGFPVVLTLAPNNLTRVLVGPYPDTATLGRAKTDLENAGMHPVRYHP